MVVIEGAVDIDNYVLTLCGLHCLLIGCWDRTKLCSISNLLATFRNTTNIVLQTYHSCIEMAQWYGPSRQPWSSMVISTPADDQHFVLLGHLPVLKLFCI